MFTIAGHMRERLRFSERLAGLIGAVLLPFLFLIASPTLAGSYTLTSQTGGTYSDSMPESWPYSTSQKGYGAETPGYVTNGTTTCTGTITTVYTWQPGYPGELPPQDVIITQHCDAMWFATDFSDPVTGSCDDGLGDAEQGENEGDPISGYDGTGESTGTHYKVQTGGNTITITCSPSATATSSTGFTLYACVFYSVQISPITIDTKGTTLDVSTLKNLTGQQIVATLLGIPSGYSIVAGTYQWSVGGDTFKTYNENASSNQLVALTAADKAASSFSFYDKTQETITINCSATIQFPDSTTSPISAQSQPISVLKPTASWAVDPATIMINGTPQANLIGFFDDSAKTQTFGLSTTWYPVHITVPSPFSGGIGCFAQIVTPSASITRIPTGNGASTYTLKIRNAQGDWVAPGTGLDGKFPYHFGLSTDANGNITGIGPDPYTWSAGGTGASGDTPKGQESVTDVDMGGSNWQTSSISDSFTTWLMYQPPANGTGIIWVPLMKANWSGSGNATGGPDHWTATGSYSAPSPGNASDYPQWSTVIVNQAYQP